MSDLIKRAIRAVEDNARHSRDSLAELLDREFPGATDAEIEEAVSFALGC